MWKYARNSPLLWVWWAFFILHQVTGLVHGFPASGATDLEKILAEAQIAAGSHLLGIPSAIAAAVLILKISLRQKVLSDLAINRFI